MVLLVAGILVWRLHGSGEYIAPTPTPGADREADTGAANAALSALVRDVRRRRTEPGSGPVATVLRNAVALGVDDFDASYVAEDGPVAADGAWNADVEVRWRYGGFDQKAVTEQVPMRFSPTSPEAVRIARIGGRAGSDQEKTPVWLSGPVTVRRTPQTLVVVRGGATEAAQYTRLARTAVATVRRVVPWPDPRLVVEVPAESAALEAALGADPGSYSDVAAVTTTVDGSGVPGRPVHVFVNPDAIGKPGSIGAQVVMSHEATHDATHAVTTSNLPTWLTEGFADYVALRDVKLPLSTTAGQILKDVRRHGPPAHLPSEAEFNAQSSTFGEEYESAWLACRVLAEIGGEHGLVEVYDRVEAGEPLGRVLRSVIGMSVGAFTKVWQHRLSHWAA